MAAGGSGRLTGFAYGALGLPLAFAALPVYVHVPRLYAEAAGIGLGLLGLILLAVRLVDAVSDPWLGWLADRWPRRRLIALAVLPLAAGFAALFLPPAGWSQSALALWLTATLILTTFAFSAATIAHQAWGADLGGDADGRTRLTAWREGCALSGVVLAAALPGLLVDGASDPGGAAGLAMLAWIFPPLLAGAVLLALWQWPQERGFSSSPSAGEGRGERGRFGVAISPSPSPLRGEGSAAGVSLRASLVAALADPAFARLLAIFVANGIAAALPATLVLFFIADRLGAPGLAGAFLAAYFIAGVLGVPLWTALARRVGRARAWLVGMLLAAFAFVGAYGLGHGDLAGFAFVCVATGLALGADLVLPAALAADLGERRGNAGACFGLWNFVNKLNLALAAGLALPLLALFGYRPGGESGLEALAAAYALLPLAFKALAAALLWHWRHRLEPREERS